MKLSFFTAALIALSVITGCATAPADAPKFSAAPAAPEGFATVYVFRLSAPPFSREIKLSIAGKPLFAATEQAYTWAYVRAGTHTVYAEWPTELFGSKQWPDASTTLALEAGKSYFVRALGDVGIVSGGFLSGGSIVRRSGLIVLPQETGQAQLIACCRYIKPVLSVVE
ncbi:DUF2846 domain-containing protein [Limnohabitans sp.]|jgi:hypothetical protein|uniref:DUF2846 domain-containing protein n=1 Tax=Limnohabitans sp. TaxID=1907725 RepID=UPI0037BF84F8